MVYTLKGAPNTNTNTNTTLPMDGIHPFLPLNALQAGPAGDEA